MKVKDILNHSNAIITTIIGTEKDGYPRLAMVRYDLIEHENEINDIIPVVTSKVLLDEKYLNMTVDFISASDTCRINIFTK